MSRVSTYERMAAHGIYRAKYEFPGSDAADFVQLHLQEGDLVQLREQQIMKGWVWAKKTRGSGTGTAGHVPIQYLEQVAQGGWDRWAYGSEVVACFSLHLFGLFVLMFGSQELDGDMNMALGTIAMFFGSMCMLMVFFRQKLGPVIRGFFLALCSVPLLFSIPVGVFGGAVVLMCAVAELVRWWNLQNDDEEYHPPDWTVTACCGFIFSENRTVTGYLAFIIWMAMNGVVFWLGWTMGRDDAEEWRDKDDYQIPRSEWAFAQASGTVISFDIMMLLLFQLQGIQGMLISSGDSVDPTYKNSFKARMKDYLKRTFTEENMVAVHVVIASTMLVAVVFHLFGNYATFDRSGAKSDYEDHFGQAPFITGGAAIVLLGIVVSSSWISPEISPAVFRLTHRAALAMILLLVVHGRDWLNPNFWKFIIAPIFLYAMDKMFRLGVFGYGVDGEYEIEGGGIEENTTLTVQN